MFVALAAAVVSLVGSPGLERRLPLPALAALGLVVGAAPLIVVYEFEGGQLWGRRGSLVVAVLLVGPLTAAAGLRFAKTRQLAVAVAPFAAVLVVMGVNYASAASATTHLQFETNDSILAEADDVFSMGVDLVRFMHANDLEETLPAFWFDESADPSQTGDSHRSTTTASRTSAARCRRSTMGSETLSNPVSHGMSSFSVSSPPAATGRRLCGEPDIASARWRRRSCRRDPRFCG